MAKKRTAPKMHATAEPRLKPIRLDIDPAYHKKLRIQAAKDDMSMAALARAYVYRCLDEVEKQERR